MSRLKDLIHEIHRRSLWQVLGIYVVGGWIAFQVAQTLTEGLGLPDWFPGLALGLLIVLLPVVLATAFVREGVGGPRPVGEPLPETAAESAEEARGARQRALTWRNAGFAFVIALGVWGVVATGWMLFGRGADERATEDDRPSVAVLPLENRSGLEEDRYFTDGIHDEILAHLSKISALSVRARTSVMEYRDRTKNVRQIGEELNARYLLEGGVQRAGETVRIIVQLVDTQTDEHIFADTYDRELSLENVLAVQREVALRIADALEATLTEQERQQIAKVPTENPEAYDYYLRGIDYGGRGYRLDDLQNAQRMFERAVELDPRFALAYARLALLHTSFYTFALDRSEERERQSREAAERALQIDPDLPEGHLALGYCYSLIHHDYDRALEELAIAERGLPGEVTLLYARGLIWRSQGKWEEALASLERAVTLSPRSSTMLYELGDTYLRLRRYEEAETHFDRELALRPDWAEVALAKAMVQLNARGDTEPLRTLVEGVPPGFDPSGLVTFLHWYVEYLDRDFSAALEIVAASEREYVEFQEVLFPKTLLMGFSYEALGEADLARATADSARRGLAARLRERPEDPRLHTALSYTHAVLGNRDAAVRAAQQAVELMPISKDAMEGPEYVWNLAIIYAAFGEVDAAVEQFERYLSVPARESIKSTLLNPAIDPIRDHPCFQALVEK